MRPFEPTGLTTQLWELIPPTKVKLKDLVLVQETVTISGLKNALEHGPTVSGDATPHVVVYKGKKYLSDGYHRYCISLIRGEEEMYARVYEKND